MPTAARIAPRPAVQAAHHPRILPADLRTAANLKLGVNTVLRFVKLGTPLEARLVPQQDAKGHWKSAAGHKLIEVNLSGKPPAGARDWQSHYALVDPLTNQFYDMTSGGIIGRTIAHGPLELQHADRFEGKSFSQAAIDELSRIANKNPPKPPAARLPTATLIKNAMGAYNFHHMLNYKANKPSAAIQARIELKGFPTGPDTYKYTALVLQSDPHKVIIQRSGGKTGQVMYSNTIDVSRIPK